jgi:hypothetical protein
MEAVQVNLPTTAGCDASVSLFNRFGVGVRTPLETIWESVGEQDDVVPAFSSANDGAEGEDENIEQIMASCAFSARVGQIRAAFDECASDRHEPAPESEMIQNTRFVEFTTY